MLVVGADDRPRHLETTVDDHATAALRAVHDRYIALVNSAIAGGRPGEADRLADAYADEALGVLLAVESGRPR